MGPLLKERFMFKVPENAKTSFFVKSNVVAFVRVTNALRLDFATGIDLSQGERLTVWPESLGPKTPKGNLKTPKKNTTLKTRKHHVFGYKNTKYLIKSFKNGPPKHFYCIFVHQFLKNFNFFTEIFQKISIFF